MQNQNPDQMKARSQNGQNKTCLLYTSDAADEL